MPSPIAHSLVGYLIYRVASRPFDRQKRYIILLYLLVANIPDLDFLPGIFVGNANKYHHGISHSIGFSLIFALGCYIILRLLRHGYARKYVTIFSCLYFSHIIIDYLTKAPGNSYGDPVGAQFFWPFSNEYYIAPFAFFSIIHFQGGSASEFVFSLLSLNNLMAISVEFIILSPILLTTELWKYWRKKHHMIC